MYKHIYICRRFCDNLYVPKTLDIQVCPVYGSTLLGLRDHDYIDVYKFEKGNRTCQLEKHDSIESNDLTNFVCFGSGYIEYLAISGQEPRLLHNFENEFQDNTNLRLGEITLILFSKNLKRGLGCALKKQSLIFPIRMHARCNIIFQNRASRFFRRIRSRNFLDRRSAVGYISRRVVAADAIDESDGSRIGLARLEIQGNPTAQSNYKQLRFV